MILLFFRRSSNDGFGDLRISQVSGLFATSHLVKHTIIYSVSNWVYMKDTGAVVMTHYPIDTSWPTKLVSGTDDFIAPVILPDKISAAREGSCIAARPKPRPSTASMVESTANSESATKKPFQHMMSRSALYSVNPMIGLTASFSRRTGLLARGEPQSFRKQYQNKERENTYFHLGS